MHTHLERINGEPWIVVEDVPAAYHDAVRDLGYQDLPDGSFGGPAAAGNPYVPRACENFARFAEPMILQAARAIPVPWETALAELLRFVEGQGIDWWLLGSAALAARGLSVGPRDIDLVVADEDMPRLERLLLDYLVQPVIASPGWVHNSFARAFLHARVEWVGGVVPLADAEYPSDQGPIAAASLEVIRWHGHRIRVPPLSLQFETSRQRGLTERVRVIEQAMRLT
ncbi:MAG TPA: hypothetical protein VFB58_03320 [Chloroflexota bacterium]|nr:hypothetical protein [Chloroflexota bacterium]